MENDPDKHLYYATFEKNWHNLTKTQKKAATCAPFPKYRRARTMQRLENCVWKCMTFGGVQVSWILST